MVVKLFCMILLWCIHVTIHCLKPTECTTPRVNPNVSNGLWAIMMHQSRLINYNSRTTLGWDVRSWGGCVYGRRQRYLGPLYFPLSFAVDLKLL